MQHCAWPDYINTTDNHHDVAAETEYIGELAAHGVLEVLGFGLGHLTSREVKYFLTAHNQPGKTKILNFPL